MLQCAGNDPGKGGFTFAIPADKSDTVALDGSETDLIEH